ncbi:MAG: single-stranded DNA-binding protein [Angelakisella sp.]
MLNKAILIGRLTTEPEKKTTSGDISVVNVTLAIDRAYKGESGERKADFIGCVVWRQQADFLCKYFHKGDPIGIEGSIQSRNYEDKEGNKRTAVEVQADNVFFVGGKAKGGAPAADESEGETA